MIVIFLSATMLNADVTQQSVQQTICLPHYSTTYRRHHPVRIPTRPGMIRDHRVPLELGGSSDRSNIQWQSKAEARAKDRIENALHDAVCAGRVSLRDAQLRMEAWR